MGRKNKTKKATRVVASSSNYNNNINVDDSGDGLSFLSKENRQQLSNGASYYNEPTLFPQKPSMSHDPMRMQDLLLNSSPKNRSATANRLIEAHQMLNDIEKIQKERGDYYDENLVDISLLKRDSSYIRECVLWIKAMNFMPTLMGNTTG